MLKMIVLETLFIMSSHFLLVTSEENNTGSLYQGMNSTVLPSSTYVSPTPSTQVQNSASSSITEQPPATGLLDVKDSTAVTRGPNDKLNYSSILHSTQISSPTPSSQVQYNARSSITEKPFAEGLSKANDSIVKSGPNDKIDNSSYEENSAFFSKNLAQRLRAWKNTLENAAKQCVKDLIKLNIGNITEESVEIKFPVFQGKDIDPNADFLTLEKVHPVLVSEKSGHDLVNVAYLSILELWPLLVLCFTCAALSGMILWFLVSIN